MGAWGLGIFSNDAADDVREDFRDLIAAGFTADEATTRLREEHGVERLGVDANDFWLALAATQHKVGHVGQHVLERALDIIDDPVEMERWAPKDRRRRAAALAKLKSTLESPPSPARRLRPRTKVETHHELGQHVVVPLPGGERSVLLRVTGVTEDRGGRYPHVVVVKWNGKERQLHEAHRLPATLDPTPMRDDEAWGFTLIGEPSDPKDLRVLSVVMDRLTPTRQWESGTVVKWSELGGQVDAASTAESS